MKSFYKIPKSKILQNKDFKRDPDDPEKLERYQAEALVYNNIPVEAFIGIVCYTDTVELSLSTRYQQTSLFKDS